MPCGMEHSLLLKPATIFLDGDDQMIGIMAWHAWVLFGPTLDSFMIAVAHEPWLLRVDESLKITLFNR